LSPVVVRVGHVHFFSSGINSHPRHKLKLSWPSALAAPLRQENPFAGEHLHAFRSGTDRVNVSLRVRRHVMNEAASDKGMAVHHGSIRASVVGIERTFPIHQIGALGAVFYDAPVAAIPNINIPIWERLYRGDKSRSQRGLGLGLSLVKAIVEAHHGEVLVQSKPGEGSEFIVHIPPLAGQATIA
jgi:Histidine kinase-, DNA gyrase B-, and HSP90-like ATPase